MSCDDNTERHTYEIKYVTYFTPATSDTTTEKVIATEPPVCYSVDGTNYIGNGWMSIASSTAPIKIIKITEIK